MARKKVESLVVKFGTTLFASYQKSHDRNERWKLEQREEEELYRRAVEYVEVASLTKEERDERHPESKTGLSRLEWAKARLRTTAWSYGVVRDVRAGEE